MTADAVASKRHTAVSWIARLVVMTAVTFALYIGVELLVGFAIGKSSGAARPLASLAAVFVACLVLPGAYRLLVLALEQRPTEELRARPGALLFGAGLVSGCGLFTLVLIVLALVGAATFAGIQGWSGFVSGAAFGALAAVGEEIVFRGCLFRILEEGFGTGLALVVSSGLFGLIHLIQPGATLVSALAIALEAGVLLALAFAAARNLWLPIGAHMGWNFAEGGIFSQPVSGGHARGLIEVTLNGSDLITGGAFGPEGSVIAVAVSLAASAGLLAFVLRSGRWRPFAVRLART